MKRIIAFTVCFIMLFSNNICFGLHEITDSDGNVVLYDSNGNLAYTYGDYKYCVDNGSAKIVEYTGKKENISIPASINGYPVKYIGDGQTIFKDKKLVKTIVIPEGVTRIDNAFRGSLNLTEIKLPESLEWIESNAFADCPKLKSLHIPKNVRWLIDYNIYDTFGSFLQESNLESMFIGCESMESITVDPDNEYYSSEDGILYSKDKLKLFACPPNKSGDVVINSKTGYIIREAFLNCKNITSVTMPEYLGKIGNSAFKECSGITNLVIPNSVYSIEDYAFYHCDNLESVTLPEALYEDNTLNTGLFMGCEKLKSVNLPFVKTIGVGCFTNCSSLENISIPRSVNKIMGSAFSSCGSLKSIEIPDTVKEIGESAFYVVPAWKRLSFRKKSAL